MKTVNRAVVWLGLVGLLLQPNFGMAGNAPLTPKTPAVQTIVLRQETPPVPQATQLPVIEQPAPRLATQPQRSRHRTVAPVSVPAPVELVAITVTQDPQIIVTSEEGINLSSETTATEVTVTSSPTSIDLVEDATVNAAAILADTPSDEQPTQPETEEPITDEPVAPEVTVTETTQEAVAPPPAVTPPAQVAQAVQPAAASAVPPVPAPPALRPIVDRGEVALPATRELAVRQPVVAVRMPYQNALYCLAGQLTTLERRESFTLGRVVDDSGHAVVAGDQAAGSIGSLNGAPILQMALLQGGVTVTRTDPAFRDVYNFQSDQGRRNQLGDGQVRNIDDGSGRIRQSMVIPSVDGRLSPAEYLVEGNVVSIDNGGGTLFEAGAAGVSLGRRDIMINILMVVTVTRMPLGSTVGGEVVDSFPILIQVRGREIRAGLYEFLGGTPLPVRLDFRHNQRQALQFFQQVGWHGAGYLVLKRHYTRDGSDTRFDNCDTYLPFATVAQ